MIRPATFLPALLILLMSSSPTLSAQSVDWTGGFSAVESLPDHTFSTGGDDSWGSFWTVGGADDALPSVPSLERIGAADQRSLAGAQQREPSFWRHLLIGSGAGLVMGFVHGWSIDGDQSPVESADSFWNFESDHYYRIMHSLIGAGIGGATGTSIYLMRR